MYETLGNLGDFIGGVAVVITLIYLAVQVRQNSKNVKTSAAQAVMQAMSEYYRAASETPELARAVGKAFTDFESLDDTEIFQYYLWSFGWLRLVELAHHHYSLGNLPSSFWDGQVAHLKSVMQTPATKRFWELRKAVFSAEFCTFVDTLDLSGGPAAAGDVAKLFLNDPPPNKAIEADA